MADLLAALLAYPTVVWTVLLGVCMVFWAFVIVGAADLDVGGAKLEGAAHAAIDGTADALAGAVKGGAEAAASSTSVAELFGFLKLDRVPVTITASFFSLFGWLLSFFASGIVGGGALVGTGVLAVSAIASLFLTSLAARPFAILFDEATRTGGATLVGKSVIVRSGKVDEKGGQAELDERGASLVVDVRLAAPGQIAKGQEVVIVEYDQAADCYVVAPMPNVGDGPTDRAGAERADMISHPVEALADRPKDVAAVVVDSNVSTKEHA